MTSGKMLCEICAKDISLLGSQVCPYCAPNAAMLIMEGKPVVSPALCPECFKFHIEMHKTEDEQGFTDDDYRVAGEAIATMRDAFSKNQTLEGLRSALEKSLTGQKKIDNLLTALANDRMVTLIQKSA